MKSALAQHPFMREDGFIQTVVQTIEQQVPQEHKPAFKQRLDWLKQLANKWGHNANLPTWHADWTIRNRIPPHDGRNGRGVLCP